ncbi:MAG: DUF4435 domain-containing protein [Proteobacteria bacterium]|nr:MAG: DUF4435 domain-containing protein [Pseudomonadota bacterium]
MIAGTRRQILSRPLPTVDEVIATLRKTSDPTLLAEGIDDITFLRRLEDIFEEEGLSVLPLGGRDAVLKIFDRRAELPDSVPLLFLVDQDAWIHTEIPEGYQHTNLLATDGYSIENDLYRDGQLEKLLTAREKSAFKAELTTFLRWYSLAVARHINDRSVALAVHPNALLENPIRLQAETTLKEGEVEPTQLALSISQSYERLVRGKSLMGLLLRHLSAPKRPARHNSRSLLEHAATAQGPMFTRIVEWLRGHLPPPNGTAVTGD